MKKSELVLGAIALTGCVSSMITPQVAFAALGCSNGTAAAPMTCTGTTAASGTYIAEAFSFTGSNGVQMGVGDSATIVALCGSHIQGKNHYGLTTDGGSMESASGTGTATSTAGGCN